MRYCWRGSCGDAHEQLQATAITHAGWSHDGRVLFIIDQEGHVCACDIASLLGRFARAPKLVATIASKLRQRRSAFFLGKLDSSPFQLISGDSLLASSVESGYAVLISTVTSTRILRIDRRQLTESQHEYYVVSVVRVGTQERHGNYGACVVDISRKTRRQRLLLAAARPKRRVWLASLEEGKVKTTVKYQASRHDELAGSSKSNLGALVRLSVRKGASCYVKRRE